jgi:hypothetical protein
MVLWKGVERGRDGKCSACGGCGTVLVINPPQKCAWCYGKGRERGRDGKCTVCGWSHRQ